MGNIHFQEVRESDLKELQEIAIQTYYETFISRNKASDMELYLSRSFSIEQLQKEFRHPHSQFLLAKEDNITVGYLKLNKKDAQTEQKLENSLEIERIYVRASYQGRGIGQMLMEKAIAIAKREGFKTIWLGVEEKNVKAVQFYEKNRFRRFDTHMFLMGEDEQLDLLMKMELG